MGKKLTTQEFIKRAKEIHGDKYDYSKVEYTKYHNKVCIICPEHGEFWQDASGHLSGHSCPKCSTIEVHHNQSNKKEGFIQKAKETHSDKYDYSKVEYVNNHTKVCIICPEHGEFWQKPIHHTQGKGCPYCGGTKKLTTEEFIKKANEIHNERYDYSKINYKTSETKVCIICPEHGEFWQTPHAHLTGQGCPKCYGNIKLSTEEFIKKANEIHNNKYDYSKVNYLNSETKVCIICPEHGKFWQTPHSHLTGQGCPKCAGKNKTIEDFIHQAKEIHGNKYDYSKVNYVGTETKVCIICPEHGEFWQTPHNHIGNCQGCPECNTTKNSKIVQKIETKLKEFNIQYIKEKTFDWLKSKSHMYLDFFLPEYNVAIECHGLQHFEPVEYFGGKIAYDKRYEMDTLKYKLCSEHNIKIYYFTDIDSEYFEKLYCNEDSLIKDICRQK